MPRLTAQQRANPAATGQMVDSIFKTASENAKRSYYEFLLASIAHLSQHNPNRWGVTLREYGVRLNAGWVESLVLRQGEPLRVLVEIESAPPTASFCGRTYRYAPGCRMVPLSLSELPRRLTELAPSHQKALKIAGRHHAAASQYSWGPLAWCHGMVIPGASSTGTEPSILYRSAGPLILGISGKPGTTGKTGDRGKPGTDGTFSCEECDAQLRPIRRLRV